MPLHYPNNAKRVAAALQVNTPAVGTFDGTIVNLRPEANYVTVSTNGNGTIEFLAAGDVLVATTFNNTTAQMYPIPVDALKIRINNSGASQVFITQLGIYA